MRELIPQSAKINQGQRRRGRTLPHRTIQTWILLMGLVTVGVAGYFIMVMGEAHQVVLSTKLRVPAHLVDYAEQYEFVFVVIYAPDQARPLAVMKEPLRVRVSTQSRRQGYHRRVVVSLSKLEFMQLPGAMAAPPTYEQLVQGLAQLRKQPPAVQSQPRYEFKVLLDQDGVVGGAQMSSLRKPFYLGQTGVQVDVQPRASL